MKHGYKFEENVNIALQSKFKFQTGLDEYLDNLNNYYYLLLELKDKNNNFNLNFEAPFRKDQDEIVIEYMPHTLDFRIVEDFDPNRRHILIKRIENKLFIQNKSKNFTKIVKNLNVNLYFSQIDGVFSCSEYQNLREFIDLSINADKELIKNYFNNYKENIIILETKNNKDFKTALKQIYNRKKHFFDTLKDKRKINFLFCIMINASIKEIELIQILSEIENFNLLSEARLIVMNANNENKFLDFNINNDINSQICEKLEKRVFTEISEVSKNVNEEFANINEKFLKVDEKFLKVEEELREVKNLLNKIYVNNNKEYLYFFILFIILFFSLLISSNVQKFYK